MNARLILARTVVPVIILSMDMHVHVLLDMKELTVTKVMLMMLHIKEQYLIICIVDKN
jgi:hypothetical protein